MGYIEFVHSLVFHQPIHSSHVSGMSTVYKMLRTQRIQKDTLPLFIYAYVALFKVIRDA